jgi:hypothetical protein
MSFHEPDCLLEAMSEQLARADQFGSERTHQGSYAFAPTSSAAERSRRRR